MTATTLYRIYGAHRRLLYVGITSNLDRRLGQHAEKFWWPEVRAIDTEEFADRAEAAAAELAAIAEGAPAYNRTGNGPKQARAPLPAVNVTGKRQLVSIQQAADYAQVSTRTIRRWIAEGRLRAARMGPRLIRVDQADLDAMFAAIPTAEWHGGAL